MAELVGVGLAIVGGLLVELLTEDDPQIAEINLKNKIDYKNTRNFVVQNSLEQNLDLTNIQSCSLNVSCYIIEGSTITCEQYIANEIQQINTSSETLTLELLDELYNTVTNDVTQEVSESDDVFSAVVEWLQTETNLTQEVINQISTAFETNVTNINIQTQQESVWNAQDAELNITCYRMVDTTVSGLQGISNKIVFSNLMQSAVDIAQQTITDNDLDTQLRQYAEDNAGIFNPESVGNITMMIIIIAVVIGVIVFLIIGAIVLWLIFRRRKPTPPPMMMPPPAPPMMGYPQQIQTPATKNQQLVTSVLERLNQ